MLFPVRPALPSNDRVVSGFIHSSSSSSTGASSVGSHADDERTSKHICSVLNCCLFLFRVDTIALSRLQTHRSVTQRFVFFGIVFRLRLQFTRRRISEQAIKPVAVRRLGRRRFDRAAASLLAGTDFALSFIFESGFGGSVVDSLAQCVDGLFAVGPPRCWRRKVLS